MTAVVDLWMSLIYVLDVGPDHLDGVSLVAGGEDRGDSRREQPQVGEDHLVEEGGVGSQVAEGVVLRPAGEPGELGVGPRLHGGLTWQGWGCLQVYSRPLLGFLW